MNSEELEHSLRAEFDSYITGVKSQLRDETLEFQKKIETDFDEQRARFDEAFKSFSSRFDGEHEFDVAFTESVTEHLRLARDEGAKITANAIAEAELMQTAAAPAANFAKLREAISDISSKDSQSTILKSLITHAAEYTPRGAFFIIKNEHFVGWKVFGEEGSSGESAIRDIHFPISDDSILGKAATSLSTVDGSLGDCPDDSQFLDPLEFGTPDRMYAIPLKARGRAVAVLYADYGREGAALDTDALEALVHVAGMTVELLAASRQSRSVAGNEAEAPIATSFDDSESRVFETTAEYSQADIMAPEQPAAFEQVEEQEPETVEVDPVSAFDETISTEESKPSVFTEPIPAFETVAGFEPPVETDRFGAFDSGTEVESFEPKIETFEPEAETTQDFGFVEPVEGIEQPSFESTPEIESIDTAATSDFAIPVDNVSEPAIVYEAPQSSSQNPFEASPFEAPAFEPPFEAPTFETPVSLDPPAVVETAAAPPRSRLSDRNVDLPIDVAEDERRLHNDARRFARLLVSEIKLYNEKKVQEGRESNDLYNRLKEAIDRSREMYDKRVQPPVAAKFDYFHYEVVSSLGEGDEMRLGSNYPGATV